MIGNHRHRHGHHEGSIDVSPAKLSSSDRAKLTGSVQGVLEGISRIVIDRVNRRYEDVGAMPDKPGDQHVRDGGVLWRPVRHLILSSSWDFAAPDGEGMHLFLQVRSWEEGEAQLWKEGVVITDVMLSTNTYYGARRCCVASTTGPEVFNPQQLLALVSTQNIDGWLNELKLPEFEFKKRAIESRRRRRGEA